VVGVAEPYAAFGDGPEAAAVRGAVSLDTLVVAPAGNDGPAGPRYGSIGGPGAASAALTVGAAESRGGGQLADVSLRAGLQSVFDGSFRSQATRRRAGSRSHWHCREPCRLARLRSSSPTSSTPAA
jgi:hypothetical protein